MTSSTPPVDRTPPEVDHVPAVSMRNVSKLYGEHVALRDVSLTVPAGSVCGLIGPNGAGKSTMLAIIATLLRPSAGQVDVLGVPISDTAVVRRLIGYVPDVLGTYSGLTVAEYLMFFAEAYDVDADTRGPVIDGLLDLVDLTDKRDADVNTLSRGMKQRIGLARGLVHEPRLLLLDEPASGLDPRARVELQAIVSQLNSSGVTVLISSHILAELEEMCTHVVVLEQGVLAGVEDLTEQPARTVMVTFLGGTVETFQVGTEQQQVELVESLVADGRQIVSVTAESTRLVDRFMRLTDGRTN